MKRKLLAFCIGLLLTSVAFGQVANINASQTSGCNPLTVVFTDGSTGATSWSWTFGNGNTSTLQNPPPQIYLSPGPYTVTLSINGGAKTTTKTITVNASPVVSFIASDTTGTSCFPLLENFTDRSTPIGSIVAWNWDFGDGTPASSAQNPSHTYTGAANFPVTLQVTGSNGCSSTLEKLSYINIANGVTAGFTTNASSGCNVPITVNFTNTSTGPGTLTYNWSFGDGNTSTVQNPSNSYTTAGTYSATLNVSSTSGCNNTISENIVVGAGSVQSSFTAPDSICLGNSISFVNTSIPNPVTSNWDFGDGTNSTLINPTKTYLTPNTYTVKLVNDFGGCKDSTTKQIAVLTAPVANFKANDSVTCNPTLSVSFTDLSTNATIWSWSFGDGTTSTLQNPTHTYTNYGSYTVTLTASNSTGCSGTVSKTNYIQVAQPNVLINGLPLYACAPVKFTPSFVDTLAGGIASYLWDFGDGTTSTAQNPPTHTYPAGIYVVKLTLTGVSGCIASTTDTVKSGTAKPTAAFTASTTSACADQGVNFTDQSTGVINNWLWDFGDMTTATNQNPMHSYITPGTYTVTEVVYNNGCGDTLKKINYIVVNVPKADFSYTAICTASGSQYTFTNNSTGADVSVWDFGDGTTYTGTTPPPHTFPGGALSDTVTLSVTNNTTLCTDTKKIGILNQAPTFSISNPVTCKNTNVFISISSSTTGLNPAGYYYNYGDGYFAGPVGSLSWAHKYTKTGIYSITVTTTNISGCKDSLTMVNAVTVNGPTAQFTSNATSGCTGLAAVFTDQSTSDGMNNIVKWIWDYGDGTIQTYAGGPFTHNYTRQGIYSVKLTVVDASGCMDSSVKTNFIAVSFPHASFAMSDSLSCPGAPITFINNSSGYGLTYNWDFGDGTNSTALNPPPHNYAIGTDIATLTVLDQYGCTDMVSHMITVDTPHASFTLTSTLANCPPLIDTFTFTGSYYNTIKWYFGDGGTSSLLNPIHFYNIPGTYFDTLIVTSHGGCTDTAFSPPIQIFGPYGALSYSPLEGCHTLTVNFNVVTNNVVKYTWDFGNNSSVTTLTPSITFTYDSAGKFLPVVVLTDASNCAVPVYGSDSIIVEGSKVKFGYDNNVFCNSGAVTFTDSTVTVGTVATYAWDFGDGSTSNLENDTHFYALPGTYTVKLYVTTQNGCVDSLVKTALVKVVASPSVDIGGINYSLCAPGSMNFQGLILVPDTSALTWSWNFFNGNTSNLQNPPAQTYTNANPDSIQVVAINSTGCTDTVKRYFQLNPPPLTNAGPDTAICVGQGVTLQATGAATFTWLSIDNTLSCHTCANPTATPVVTTSYVVVGYTALGCTTSDTVVVNVIQPATLTVMPTADSICIGQSVLLIANGETTYNWSPANGLSNANISNPLASPDTTTTYQVIGSDYKSCFADTQYVKISVFNYPTINAGADVTIPSGTTYQINAIGSPDIDSILWTPPTGLSCTNCFTPVAAPITTTTYIADVINNGGCKASDSITIIVLCNNNNLFIPNTFSPNGDGVNDVFYVRGKGLSRVQSILIFNRWGQVVFEKKDFAANDPSAGWDGTINGKPGPVDVYVYTVEVICDNSQIVPYHGNVALIR